MGSCEEGVRGGERDASLFFVDRFTFDSRIFLWYKLVVFVDDYDALYRKKAIDVRENGSIGTKHDGIDPEHEQHHISSLCPSGEDFHFFFMAKTQALERVGDDA